MGLYRLCNQIKFTFDVCLKGVEFRPASWIVGSLVAKALQIGVNISDRGGVAVQKRLVAGENVRVAGIVRAKNLAPEIFKKRLHLARVSDHSFARKKPVSRANQKHAAGDEQGDCNRERQPGDTSEGKGHRANRGLAGWVRPVLLTFNILSSQRVRSESCRGFTLEDTFYHAPEGTPLTARVWESFFAGSDTSKAVK